MSTIQGRSLSRRIQENQDALRLAMGDAPEVSILREQMGAVVRDLLRFEDEGNWTELFGSPEKDVKGLKLKDLQEVVPYLQKQTKILGDLLGRGLRLKNNHVFGRGCMIEAYGGGKIAPRFSRIIDDPVNQEVLFSLSAMKMLNRTIFTAGNLVVMYDRAESRFQHLSIDCDIVNWISEDDDPSRLKYLLREWSVRDDLGSAQSEMRQEWIPISTHKPKGGLPKTIRVGNKDVPVSQTRVIIFRAYNKEASETFGVPDAFAAAAPAHIYASYMRDGAMLQHALAAISFLVKAKTEAAAKAAGAKIQRNRVGQAAIAGPETEIQSMPRAGSIDLYEGRPLVARVASALDVSTTGITSDPGRGGSYASENALSAPEQMSALSRQEDFSDFFREVFRVMGAKDIVVNWSRVDTDPVHRQMQSLGIARDKGAINQAEMRERSLELLDIEKIGEGLPEPDEFTGAKPTDANLMDDSDPDNSGTAAQGVSGTVGSLDDANSARADDSNSGTA